MINKNQIHIVIPAYNEGRVINEIIVGLHRNGYKNIVVIDDGSSDDTKNIVSETGTGVISLAANRGAGAATQTGIDYAKSKDWPYIILMDADGQHHISDIPLFINKMNEDKFDIVIGNRFEDSNDQIPIERVLLNKLASIATNFFCKNKYVDTQCGFRMLGPKAIEKLDLKVDGFGFCSEMLIVGEKLGLKIAEIPISVSYNEYSMSKGQHAGNAFKTAFNFIWNIIFK